jgi:hypothetical protein
MEVNNRWLERTTANYLYLPGVTSNYASAPDSAALSVTGDIDIRCKVALDDWTPSALTALVSKSQTTTQRSYYLAVETNGRLSLYWSPNGSTQLTSTSTVAPTIADGATLWVRVTLDVDNGASGNTATFFTSDDGITWTTLGSPVVTAGTTSIFDATSQLEIGAASGGTAQAARGKFFRAQVLNGIGGTVAFDANFETGITSNLPTTFTESSANAATVTVNYSGTGYRSAGVIASTYVFPGNPNTFKLSSYSMLDFGASDDFTLIAALRPWGTLTNGRHIIFKATATFGYDLFTSATGFSNQIYADPAYPIASQTTTVGNLVSVAGVRNVTSDIVGISVNGAALTTTTDTTTKSLFNVTNLKIGSADGGAYLDFEFVSAAIFRRVLTAAEIATLNSYFQGRVA